MDLSVGEKRKKQSELSFESETCAVNAKQNNANAKPKTKKKRAFAAKTAKTEEMEEKEETTGQAKAKKRKFEEITPTEMSKRMKEDENTTTGEIENSKDDEFTIFVGNLPVNFDKKKVIKTFTAFGEVANARIRCTPAHTKKAPLKVAARKGQFTETGNSVCAYVRFKSSDSATAALEANGMLIKGHHIRVDATLPELRRIVNKKKGVYVQNIAYDISDDQLWEFFEKCGQIEGVRIIKNRGQAYLGIGVGYVNFKDKQSVELALKLDGQLLLNRPIGVRRCSAKVKQPGLPDNRQGNRPTKKPKHTSTAKPNSAKYNVGGIGKKKFRGAYKKEKRAAQSGFQGGVAEKQKKFKKQKINSQERKHKKFSKILNQKPGKGIL